MNIVLADDHGIFRECIRTLLEKAGMTVVGEASNGADALQLVRDLRPDIVVLDINMPKLSGIEVAKELRDANISSMVVMLTMYEDEGSLLESFRAGAKAYILKTQAAIYLVQAVKEVSRGCLYVSPEVAGTLVEAYLRQQVDDEVKLTFRERQILQMVAEGTITREIARMLNLSVKSVESHRSKLMRKLCTTNIAGLVHHAIRLRVISH